MFNFLMLFFLIVTFAFFINVKRLKSGTTSMKESKLITPKIKQIFFPVDIPEGFVSILYDSLSNDSKSSDPKEIYYAQNIVAFVTRIESDLVDNQHSDIQLAPKPIYNDKGTCLEILLGYTVDNKEFYFGSIDSALLKAIQKTKVLESIKFVIDNISIPYKGNAEVRFRLLVPAMQSDILKQELPVEIIDHEQLDYLTLFELPCTPDMPWLLAEHAIERHCDSLKGGIDSRFELEDLIDLFIDPEWLLEQGLKPVSKTLLFDTIRSLLSEGYALNDTRLPMTVVRNIKALRPDLEIEPDIK